MVRAGQIAHPISGGIMHNRRGFSLIEMVVAVAIVGALASNFSDTALIQVRTEIERIVRPPETLEVSSWRTAASSGATDACQTSSQPSTDAHARWVHQLEEARPIGWTADGDVCLGR